MAGIATPRRGRRSIRLTGFDYSGVATYFVTLCVDQGVCLFGDIVEDKMVLNEFGEIAAEEWLVSEALRSEVELDRYVVMPNHFHAVVVFGPQGSAPDRARHNSGRRLQERPKRSLGSLIAGYKSMVTRRINQLRSSPGG